MTLASPASKRYAEALVGATATAGPDALIKVRDEMNSFAQTFEGVGEFKQLLLNPAFSAEERTKVLDDVMKKLDLSETVRRFLRMVAERDRMPEVVEIAEMVTRLTDARAGRVRAEVESAEPLSDAAVARLKKTLEKKTGQSVEMSLSVDPALIGGVRARVGSLVFDGTVRAELDRLSDTLA